MSDDPQPRGGLATEAATNGHEPTPVEQFRRTLEGVLGVPATEGNQVDILRNGDEIFPAMLAAIEGARHTVDFLTFVYWEGEVGRRFARALADRARDGVRVRVLLDAWGAHTMERSLLELLDGAGARLHWFRPFHRLQPWTMNHRTHRKVLVVDEEIAFTGGVGIADEWLGDARDEHEWRDTHFRIRGPAVDGLRSAFLDNWAETDAEIYDPEIDRFPTQPQPGPSVVQCIRGASEVAWSDISTLFRTLLHAAEHSIRITTAYFVPDAEIERRMCEAAARGVRVQVLLPGPHADKRFVQLASEASYAALMDAGVELWAFQPSMLHAKVMTVDGVVANIGSANLNERSRAWDEEVNLVVFDPELVKTLDRHMDADIERSRLLEPNRWDGRPLRQRVLEATTLPFRRTF